MNDDRSPRDPELQAFLEQFQLVSVNEADKLARDVAASTSEVDGPRERSRRGIDPLVDWYDYRPNIAIDPTGRCNVVCEMCDFHTVRTRKGWTLRQMPELSPEVLRARLRGETRMQSITFSGGGAEFFVNKRWPELVAVAREVTPEIIVLTNGTTLTEKVRARVLEARITSIRVSLHGATAETAMEIMRGSRFEDVKRNLAELVRMRDALGLEFPRLNISFVGMKKNIDELPDFVALAHSLGADSVTLSSMIERDAEGMEHTLGQSLVDDPERLRRVWRDAAGRAASLGIRLISNAPYQSLLAGEDDAVDDEPHAPVSPGQTKLCLFPFDRPMVGVNGSVGLCCSSTGRDVELGNTDLSSFDAVWHGEAYQRVRRALITGEHMPDFCARCPRVPNVSPKTMELHAALTHLRGTGDWVGLGIALRGLRHLPRYYAELRALSVPSVRLRGALRVFTGRFLRRLGLRR